MELREIAERAGARLLEADIPTLEVAPDGLPGLLEALREAGYQILVDLCGVDHLGQKAPKRFSVVYHLRNYRQKSRVRVRVWVDEGEAVPSACGVFPGAEFPERETWEMFGIEFRGNPNLRHLLLWDGFPGHPLRKDFNWREDVPPAPNK